MLQKIIQPFSADQPFMSRHDRDTDNEKAGKHKGQCRFHANSLCGLTRFVRMVQLNNICVISGKRAVTALTEEREFFCQDRIIGLLVQRRCLATAGTGQLNLAGQRRW